MSEEMYSKGNSIELRIILLGDVGVGKKSIVNRFKIINCTETINFNFYGFLPAKKKKSHKKSSKKHKKSKKEETSTKSKKDSTQQSIESSEEESEEEKMRIHREEKRINCMKFQKIYILGFNSINISFYPCAEEEALPYDYELREEDEFYEFEKEYRVSIRNMIRELERIILKPVEDSKSQIELLFMLCFDLSNISSFEKLLVHFSQINKHFKLNDDYKVVLIGNKIDKRVSMSNDEKENIENFKSKFNLKYYEISTLMFFNFDNFFEKLILDNFGDYPMFNQYKDKFHEIISTKKTFPQTKRPPFGGDNSPPANKYNNNPYRYPDNEKEFKKMFKNRDRFNKHIFINKRGLLYPPILRNDKDLFNDNSKKKAISTDKKEMMVSWDLSKLEDVKAYLELQSNRSGYTLGVKTNKPLGLFKDREQLRSIRDQQKREALGGNIILMEDGKRMLTEGDILNNQRRYEINRKFQRDKILEEKKLRKDFLSERHDETNKKNDLEFKEKLDAVQEKQDKYTKLYEEKEKNKEKIQTENYYKNNTTNHTGYKEPKCPFYDPIPSITPNKGFTFGKKYEIKQKEVHSPDYGNFLDDFEKLIEKNKKRIVIKPLGPKIPENKSIEVGDSSKLMEKMKIFQERRSKIKKKAFNDFFEERKYKKENVILKKIEIKTQQEQNLQDQIQKTYKNDENYLIRDINYDQVESASPRFTIRAKYDIGSLFHIDKHDRDYEYSTPNKKANMLENPNFALIRPRYPAFSFGSSQRFQSISIDGRNKRNLNLPSAKTYETEVNDMENKDYGMGNLYYYGPQDYQSFLKMQTTMGTGKKLYLRDNGFPGPNQYKIKGFADLVKIKGDKINETRIMLKERKKMEDEQKQRMAKLREERFEEKRKNLKISLREFLNGIDNNNNIKTEPSVMEMHLEENNDKKENDLDYEENDLKNEEN